MENTKRKIDGTKAFKIIIAVIGILFGIFIIFLSMSRTIENVDSNPCEYVKDAKYGGDAYTGIQNAAAATANNVGDVCWIILRYSKTFMIILGVLIILHYVEKLFKIIKEM